MEKRQKTIDVWVTEDGIEHLTKHAAELHQEKQAEAKELTIQQQRNADTLAEHTARAAAIRLHWNEHPEEEEAFVEAARIKHMASMEQAIRWGWWAGVKPNGDPIPHPKIVKISELDEQETLMAHIVHNRLGLFESVNQAKKNGWGKPIQEGDFWLNKKTTHLKVIP